ncbi:MAG TPA: rod shape-determining protein RodA [Acidimicrobiales bacterium]|nr:rod shape-determining protein RodA [Acidimicrobiales bacterium]
MRTTSPTFERRRRLADPIRHLDPVLIGAVLALSVIGLLAVYSATHSSLRSAGLDPTFYLRRQAIWVALGIVLASGVMAIDYRRIRDTTAIWYGLSVLLLLLVISPLGVTTQGAQRWVNLGFFQLQPSEFAEVALVLLLASWCHMHEELTGGRFVGALVLAGVPALLVLTQPDLGTALVFGVVAIAVTFFGGARLRHLAAVGLVVAFAVIAGLSLGVLEDYQRDRLTGFVNPQGDSSSVYNLTQSQIALGAGGLTGVGLFQGTQTNLSFVPEQHTDFIFTVIGEELGFLGTATVVTLFAVVAWRVWRAALVARDRFGALLCVGVLAMMVFKIFQNIGMTMQMMPITGIPLPFLSYGGSATLASFIAVGLVLNVGSRRFT